MSRQYETPRDLVSTAMISAQRCRDGLLDIPLVGDVLFPELFGSEKNILDVASRMLEAPLVAPLDAGNLCYLIGRNPEVSAMMDIHPLINGIEPFPDMTECVRRWVT